MIFWNSTLRWFGNESGVGPFFKDDISPAPGFIVDQPPPMARSCLIGRHQYFSRVEGECFAACGGEFKDSREGNDILMMRSGMPVQRGMSRCFLEKDRFCHYPFFLGYAAAC